MRRTTLGAGNSDLTPTVCFYVVVVPDGALLAANSGRPAQGLQQLLDRGWSLEARGETGSEPPPVSSLQPRTAQYAFSCK
jgi:hypothetical protein